MRSSLAGVLIVAAYSIGPGCVPSLASNTASGLPLEVTAAISRPDVTPPATVLPLPEGGTARQPDVQEDSAPESAPAQDNPAEERNVTKTAPPPPVLYDLSSLPEPVRRMRELIVKAARTGDLEKLRPLLGKGPTQTQLAISGQEGDPIAYLHALSGDPGGQEILAILLDVLDAGFVDMNPGKPDETYVWPYFFSRPLDTLTAPQRVQLLRIVTAGDLADMKANGGYNFFRVGISPDGQWKFFVAGD